MSATREDINDNNEYFAKIQPNLGKGKRSTPTSSRPPTGWRAALIDLGWVEELAARPDPERSEPRADLQNPPWDPTGEYTLPWQAGITGIAYNIEVTGRELTSVDDLFDPVQGQDRHAHRDARHGRPLMLADGHRHPEADDLRRSAAPAFDELEKADDRRPDPGFTGNDYLRRPRRTGTSPPASAGRATSRSSRTTTRTSGS